MNENHFFPLHPNRPAVVLAPMEGVTDFYIREVLSQTQGFSFCVTEFLRVNQYVPPKKTFFEYLPELNQKGKTKSGAPVILQLLGGHEERLALTAQNGIALGACGIDINFGCPAPTVNRHDGGATLLKFPERIRSIVASVRAAVPRQYPVSAKLRLGWEDPADILKNAKMAEEGGASWITIHARTRAQGYRPPAYWKWIKEVKDQALIPVIANGDIWTIDDFEKCRDLTGCQHFMLGRGAMADPFLPQQIAFRLGLIDRSQLSITSIGPTIRDWKPWLERLVEVSLPMTEKPTYIVSRIKQWLQFGRMRQNLPWFEDAKKILTLDEMLSYLRTNV